MTTIATDGITMAADSAMLMDYVGSIEKIHRLKDGRLAGICGDVGASLQLIEYLNKAIKLTQFRSLVTDGQDGGLLLVGPGIATYLDSGSLIEVNMELPAAVGSGAGYARAAMESGATPRRALMIAKRLDPYTGGIIRMVKV